VVHRKNNKIERICQTRDHVSPPDDDLAWFNDTRGLWYSKTKHIYSLDKEPGEEWTQKAPIASEPYQKWDDVAGTWVVGETARKRAGIQKEIGEARGELSAAITR
jgi:hypothetical protein